MKNLKSVMLAAAVAATLFVPLQRAEAQAKDIVETAVAAGNFKTLVAAVQAAGLVETLKGKGPFTVFAPTDEAFAKIPKADLDALLKDKAKLTKILTYHVVAGKIEAKDVAALYAKEKDKAQVKTVEGGELKIHIMPDGKTVHIGTGGAKIVAADVQASNGVIHAIDAVLMPK
jgi:uncharacterized surface protein with fasciclin (FAS1) repeats